jgi:hypothetical protein
MPPDKLLRLIGRAPLDGGVALLTIVNQTPYANLGKFIIKQI